MKTAYFYSKNNNYELAYKLREICKSYYYELQNVNCLGDLFLMEIKDIPVLFVDTYGISENKEIMDIIKKLTPKLFMNTVLCFSKEEKGSTKNIFHISDENSLEVCLKRIFQKVEYEVNNIMNINIEKTWTKEVANYLDSYCFSARQIGYQFLRDGIIYCYSNSEAMKAFSNSLYHYLACKYQTTKYNVEHSIRRAINSAWNQNPNMKNENIPTNKEFIVMSISNIFDTLSFPNA